MNIFLKIYMNTSVNILNILNCAPVPPGDGQQPDHRLRVVRVDAVVALHQDLRRGLRAARQGCRDWANHDLDLNQKTILMGRGVLTYELV